MTNYNDGMWHDWHGGECPVRPETVVEEYREPEVPEFVITKALAEKVARRMAALRHHPDRWEDYLDAAWGHLEWALAMGLIGGEIKWG